MDKIWYRNPSKSEVIGRCGGDEKTEWPRKTDKSRTLNKNKQKQLSSSIFSNFVLYIKWCVLLSEWLTVHIIIAFMLWFSLD